MAGVAGAASSGFFLPNDRPPKRLWHVSIATRATTGIVVSVHHIPGSLGGSRLLSSLALGLLGGSSRLGSGGGLGLLGSLGRRLCGLSDSGGLGGGGLGRDLSDSLLLLVLGLDVLGSGRLALLVTTEEGTEDRGALPAGRALALVLLSVSALLLGLLLGLCLGSLGGGGSSLSGSGALNSGGLLSSLGGLGLGLLVLGLLLLLFLFLLLLLDGGREGSEGGLVLLRLGDGLGELLGLGDPQLDLADPVVTLGGAASLEGVLVSLGGQDELVGALGGGLDGIVLEDRSAGWRRDMCYDRQLTRAMALVGAVLSWPFSLKNSRPLPVSLAHAARW